MLVASKSLDARFQSLFAWLRMEPGHASQSFVVVVSATSAVVLGELGV